jgi:hypothetical protein
LSFSLFEQIIDLVNSHYPGGIPNIVGIVTFKKIQHDKLGNATNKYYKTPQ